jgi:hypothetical protein
MKILLRSIIYLFRLSKTEFVEEKQSLLAVFKKQTQIAAV